MNAGVLDSGVVISWIQNRERSRERVMTLLADSGAGRIRLWISIVNLAEVLIHTAEGTRQSGLDPVARLRQHGVQLHAPDEAVARRVARLPTSLADGFAAATALELGARLHTTDAELVRQLRSARLSITHY